MKYNLQNDTNKKLHNIDFVTICPAMTETSMPRKDIEKKFSPDFVTEGCELFSTLVGQT